MAEPQKNPESRIQEQRTIEAAKNNIMGLNGKLGCIAKNLGDPIIAEYSGGQYFSSNDMPDYLNLDQDEQEQIRSLCQGDETDDEDRWGESWIFDGNQVNWDQFRTLMKQLKSKLDPQGLLNPGRFVDAAP